MIESTNHDPANVNSTRALRRAGAVFATIGMLAAFALVSGCGSSQATFSSPDDAASALVAALAPERDVEELERIFGPGTDELASSGDEARDLELGEEFVALYQERHEFEESADGETILAVGDDLWPFPIPLRQDGDSWSFDTDAGREEILNRRIGRNELDTIQTCLAIADAQREYAALDVDGDGLREYAKRFYSEPGTRNGLFWPADEGDEPSPLGHMVAAASASGYAFDEDPELPNIFQGYRFRILQRQGPNAPGGAYEYVVNDKMFGGFAAIAWPAYYDVSGVMTFMVSHEGSVYETDLGPDTESIALEITSFDPDDSWIRVEGAGLPD